MIDDRLAIASTPTSSLDLVPIPLVSSNAFATSPELATFSTLIPSIKSEEARSCPDFAVSEEEEEEEVQLSGVKSPSNTPTMKHIPSTIGNLFQGLRRDDDFPDLSAIPWLLLLIPNLSNEGGNNAKPCETTADTGDKTTQLCWCCCCCCCCCCCRGLTRIAQEEAHGTINPSCSNFVEDKVLLSAAMRNGYIFLHQEKLEQAVVLSISENLLFLRLHFLLFLPIATAVPARICKHSSPRARSFLQQHVRQSFLPIKLTFCELALSQDTESFLRDRRGEGRRSSGGPRKIITVPKAIFTILPPCEKPFCTMVPMTNLGWTSTQVGQP